MRWLLLGWLTVGSCGTAATHATPTAPLPLPPPEGPKTIPKPSPAPLTEVPDVLRDVKRSMPPELVRVGIGASAWLDRQGTALQHRLGLLVDRDGDHQDFAVLLRAGKHLRVVDEWGGVRLAFWLDGIELKTVVTREAPVAIAGKPSGITIFPGHAVDHVQRGVAGVSSSGEIAFRGTIDSAAVGDSFVPATPTRAHGDQRFVACETPLLPAPRGKQIAVLGQWTDCGDVMVWTDGAARGKYVAVTYVGEAVEARGLVPVRSLRTGAVLGGVNGCVEGGVIEPGTPRAPAGTCFFDEENGTPVGVLLYDEPLPEASGPGWYKVDRNTRWGAAELWVEVTGSGEFRQCGEPPKPDAPAQRGEGPTPSPRHTACR